MLRILTISLILSLALVLAGCGGDDARSTKGDGDKQGKPKVDRTGYMDDTQSRIINPPLAEWNDAYNAMYENTEACDAEAQRKYREGASARESVACHLKATKAKLVAIQGLQDVMGKLEGDWREACEEELATFGEYLDEHEAAWKAVQADWTAYANGRSIPKFQAHKRAADTTSTTFIDERVPALAEACYTKEDREAESKD